MSNKDLKFHRELRKELKKDRPPIDIHKTLTLIFFIIALSAGAFFILKGGPSTTGLVSFETGNTNICYLSTGNMRMFYTKESITCNLLSSNSTHFKMEISNNFFPEKRDIKIKELSIKDCKAEYSVIIKADKSKEFTIACSNLALKEDFVLGYEDMITNIYYKITGSIIRTNLI